MIAGSTSTDRFRAAPLTESQYAAATRPPAGPLRIMVSLKNPVHGPSADAGTRKALISLAARLT